jgi:hypothetical protein
MPVVWRVHSTGSEGSPSLKVLAKSLTGLQALATDLGKAHAARDPSFAGQSEVEVQRQCELFVLRVRHGSVVLTIGTATPPKELWPDQAMPTLGPRVEEDLNEFINAVESGDEASLEKIVPDPVQRTKATRDLLSAIPDESSGHAVSWGLSNRSLREFHRPSEAILARLKAVPAIVGAGIIAGQVLLSGICVATLGPDGRPPDVQEWLDYQVLAEEDTSPYIADRVLWRDREFVMSYPVQCPVTVEEHLVVVHYEPLGIRAYAPTREEAIRDFAEELAFIWDRYAAAPDAGLTRSAVELKSRLNEFIKEVRPVEATKRPAGGE